MAMLFLLQYHGVERKADGQMGIGTEKRFTMTMASITTVAFDIV